MRGEHILQSFVTQATNGSAPRARGTLRGPRRRTPRTADQPRVRGEHPPLPSARRSPGGSAPRARGTPVQRSLGVRRRGISPACAGNTGRRSLPQPRSSDQPRVRGEHVRDDDLPDTVDGSAPRARGTQDNQYTPVLRDRISPACAGNTCTPGACRCSRADQPRVRGEHQCSSGICSPCTGSAPRARGTRFAERRLAAGDRISPACAGNTSSWTGSARGASDQPRVRGEHVVVRLQALGGLGSAPRARGTLSSPIRRRLPTRISPACAGNTWNRCSGMTTGSDQPRVRGEHARSRGTCWTTTGSAPRARGTHELAERRQWIVRISPACAGNTITGKSRQPRTPDQPRVRGEHDSAEKAFQVIDGSAPRARGTRCTLPRSQSRRRISPACAGNTRPTGGRRGTCSDQPRVRGEHSFNRSPLRFHAGSAPRARGTRLARQHAAQRGRISPACAGNTHAAVCSGPRRTDQPRVRGEHFVGCRQRDCGAGSAPRARGTQDAFVGCAYVKRISPACAGNTTAASRILPAICGSAPRARGTPRRAHRQPRRRRISPACAGNTQESRRGP